MTRCERRQEEREEELSMALAAMVTAMMATRSAIEAGTSQMPPGYPCIGPCPGYNIPSRRLGFPLLGSPSSDVRLEIFGDNLCAFTKMSWPSIAALADHYRARKASLEIRVHWFPLPYHHNAFFTAMADHWIGTSAPGKGSDSHRTGSLLFPFAEAVFASQESLLSGAVNLTELQVKERLGDIAESVGVGKSDFMVAITNHSLDLAARVAWKVAATRGVFETPTFFLNGFRVPEPYGANQGVNISGWTAQIDPLLAVGPY